MNNKIKIVGKMFEYEVEGLKKVLSVLNSESYIVDFEPTEDNGSHIARLIDVTIVFRNVMSEAADNFIRTMIVKQLLASNNFVMVED